MMSIRSIILLSLPLTARVLAQSLPEPSSQEKTPAVEQNQEFQELLHAFPEESLHAALHDTLNPKFKDGVFEGDRKAVERVHHENPSLATMLLEAAKIDLAKRQTPSNTSSTSDTSTGPSSTTDTSTPTSTPAPPASSPSSTSVPTSTTDTTQQTTAVAPASSSAAAAASSSSTTQPVIIPVLVSTTDKSGNPTFVSSSALVNPSVSVAIPITTTNSAGSTITTSTTAPGVVLTTTDKSGSVIETTAPVSHAPTAGQVITTTDAHGSTFVTTYTPGGGKISSLVLQTTTLPDGSRSTITSYAYVSAAAATGTDTAVATSTRGKPGLQTGAAGVLSRSMGWEAVAVMGGAVGVAWFI